jgi:hypothetical protein
LGIAERLLGGRIQACIGEEIATGPGRFTGEGGQASRPAHICGRLASDIVADPDRLAQIRAAIYANSKADMERLIDAVPYRMSAARRCEQS